MPAAWTRCGSPRGQRKDEVTQRYLRQAAADDRGLVPAQVLYVGGGVGTRFTLANTKCLSSANTPELKLCVLPQLRSLVRLQRAASAALAALAVLTHPVAKRAFVDAQLMEIPPPLRRITPR